MDAPTAEQELPEPVKLRAICEVSDECERSLDASDINGPRKWTDSNCKQRRNRRQESSKFFIHTTQKMNNKNEKNA